MTRPISDGYGATAEAAAKTDQAERQALEEGVTQIAVRGLESFADLGAGSDSIWGGGTLGQILRMAQRDVLSDPLVQNPWVYNAVDAQRRAFLSTRMRMYRDEDMTDELDATDELVALIRRPNSQMSERRMWGLMAANALLYGGTYWILSTLAGDPFNEGGEPGSFPECIWPIRADLLEPVLKDGELRGYRWTQRTQIQRWGTEDKPWPVASIVPFIDPDPRNPLKGLSPITALLRRVNVQFKLEGFDDGLVDNGGQVGGVLVREDGGVFTLEQQEQLKGFTENYKKPRNDRKVPLLPFGVKFIKTQVTAREMEAAKLRVFDRDTIIGTLGGNKVVCGISDDVNRANALTMRVVFYQNTIMPRGDGWSDDADTHLLAKLPAVFRDRFVSFDYRKLFSNMDDGDGAHERVRAYMGMGRSFNDATKIAGVEVDTSEMEGADERYVDSTLTLVGSEPDPDAGIESEPEGERSRALEHAREFEAMTDPIERSMIGRLNRVFGGYIRAQEKRLDAIVAGRMRGLPDWAEGDHQHFFKIEDEDEPFCGFVASKSVTPDELEFMLVQNLDKWADDLWEAVLDPIERAMDAAAADMAQRIGGTALSTTTDPAILRFIQGKELRLKEGPMSIVSQQVKRALLRGMEKSEGIGTLAERIAEVMDELRGELKTMRNSVGVRAQMIARTEVNSAANAARTEQMRRSGIVQHEWLSSGDELVRSLPPHNITGEVRVIGEPFSNGLRHPGDPGGSAANLINCRCTTVPVVPGDEE